MIKKQKKQNGITLIALVVTIVVLLILAGVSIAMLTGENGIISQAQNAKKDNKSAEIEEQVRLAVMAAKTAGLGKIDFTTLNSELGKIGYKGNDIIGGDLPVTIIIDDVAVKINKDGTTKITVKPTTLGGLKANEEPVQSNTTINDINGDSITIPAGFNVDKDSPEIVTEGIVIEDKFENQYVWIPIFEKSEERDWGVDYSAVATAKTAEKTAFIAEDYTAIQTALKTYTNTYVQNGYSDSWYGNSTNATHGYYNGEEFKYYTNGNMDEQEYNDLYNNMLVSVYKNGGFYIGRYEMGTGVATSVETASSLTRRSMTEYTASSVTNTSTTVVENGAPSIAGMPTPVSKANAVGYTYITQSQAQMLAEKMEEEYGYGNTTSSLMFGVQRDAVCVFLEKYGKLSDGTTEFDSSYLTGNANGALWGNHLNATFSMDRGYCNRGGNSYSEWNEKADKISSGAWLCTTGASDQNRVLNIYDFGGNHWEWTLEYTNSVYNPASLIGGGFQNSYSANYRYADFTNAFGINNSARVALY